MLANIEAERGRSQMTKRQVAQHLGVTHETYNAYITESRAMPSDKLVALADLFNVSTDYLLGRSDK